MKKQKSKEVTLLSAFLCLSVIMIHITATPSVALTFGSLPHVLIFALNRGLTFAVPGFIFLSGYKLYSKYGQQKIGLGEFFRGRVLKIIVPYLICLAVYFIFMHKSGAAAFSKIPEYIFLGTLASHFYYIVIAVQLYILFPILKYIFDKCPLLLILLALASTVLLNQFFYFSFSDRFFGTYIFYFVLGMLFARYTPHTNSKIFGIVSTLFAIIIAIPHFTVLYFAIWRGEYYRPAGAINVLYYTVSIAALISIASWVTSKCDTIYRYAKILDGASYDIYLYHLLPLLFIEQYLAPRLALTPKWQFILSFTALYGVAIIYALIKHRVYKSKRLFNR